MEVFFDSSVLLKYLMGDPEAKKLVERVKAGELVGYVNSDVEFEAVNTYVNLMRRELSKSSGVEEAEKAACIEEAEEKAHRTLALFKMLSRPLEEDFSEGLKHLMRERKLQRVNATIAALCKHYGIRRIATFDAEFRKLEFLEALEA